VSANRKVMEINVQARTLRSNFHFFVVWLNSWQIFLTAKGLTGDQINHQFCFNCILSRVPANKNVADLLKNNYLFNVLKSQLVSHLLKNSFLTFSYEVVVRRNVKLKHLYNNNTVIICTVMQAAKDWGEIKWINTSQIFLWTKWPLFCWTKLQIVLEKSCVILSIC